MGSPLHIEIPAVVNVALHGHSKVTFPLTISDKGTLRLQVQVTTGELGSAAIAHPLPPGWHLAVSPASLVISPGHECTVRVTLTGARGGGVHAVNVRFAAEAIGSHGQAEVVTAVASKITFSPTGAATAAPPPPAHPASDLPLIGGAAGLGGAVLIAAIGVAVRRIRARRRLKPAHRHGRRPVSAHRHAAGGSM